jgi:tRNA dimethylallyltransferase
MTGVPDVKAPSKVKVPPLIAIAGPTAAGKTQLSLQLWERLETGTGGWSGAEIVSVDSAQIYRGMDIGTAKPDTATRERVPHHLIDILDPAEAYSAARFAADAQRAIDDIRARGRIPILVGGTMLYFKALFEGLSDLPSAVPELRARIEAEAVRAGWPAMHARLAAVDPVTAARLHPNDAQRIQRALEIHESSGRPASEWYAMQRAAAAPGPVLRVAVSPPEREERYRRIEARFQAMIEHGFVDEVARLRARGDLHLGLPSMRAVGYRQLWRHLDGEYGLDEAIRLGIIATRQYAKRQLTWLRAEPQWRWLDACVPEATTVVLSQLFVAGGQGDAEKA